MLVGVPINLLAGVLLMLLIGVLVRLLIGVLIRLLIGVAISTRMAILEILPSDRNAYIHMTISVNSVPN